MIYQSVMLAALFKAFVLSPLYNLKLRVLLSLRQEMLYGMYIESLNITVRTPSLLIEDIEGTTVILNFFLESNLKTKD